MPSNFKTFNGGILGRKRKNKRKSKGENLSRQSLKYRVVFFFKACDTNKTKQNNETNDSVCSITQPKHGSYMNSMEQVKSKTRV